MNLVSSEYIVELMKFCKKKGYPYEWESTNKRFELKCFLGEFMNKDAGIVLSEVNFIKRVKNYILSKKLYQKVPRNCKVFRLNKNGECPKRNKIKYFYYNRQIPVSAVFEECWEIDLSSAYWEAAWQLGLLSKELYEEGKTVNKMTRLAAIGSLARVKSKGAFDGKRESPVDEERCDETEFLFFAICNYTAKIMYSAIKYLKNDFLFYWVDAIIFKDKKHIQVLKKFFKKKGFDCTVEPVKKVTWGETTIQVDGKRKWIEGRWVGFFKKDEYVGNFEPGHWESVRPFPYTESLTVQEIHRLAA